MLRDNALPAAGERDQPGAVLRQIIPRCARLALLAAHPCSGDELAEVGIAGVVLGKESRVKVNLPLTPGPSPPGGEGNRTSDILSLWERVGVRVVPRQTRTTHLAAREPHRIHQIARLLQIHRDGAADIRDDAER